MATRPPKDTAKEVIEDYTLDFDDDDISAETLNPALESLYAEMGLTDGGEATVHVSKLDADGRGAEASVWKGDPDNYDLEQIAKKFGSGSYRVKVYVRIPTGQKVQKANKVFAWMLSPEDDAKRLQPQVSQSQPVDIGLTVARAVADALKGMLPPPSAPVNPMAQMRELAEVMKAIMPPQQSAPQQTDQLGMMRNVIEMMNLMKGDSDPIERGANANTNDVLLGLITKFGPMFASTLAQGQQTAAPVQQVAQMPMQTAPQPQITEDEVSMKMRMGLNFLIQQAAGGGAPETYAEVVLDSVPPESVEQLLLSPDPVAFLSQFEPKVKENEVWFKALIEECRVLLAPEADETAKTS